MKALRFDRTGSLDALHLADVPEPEPGPGEVRVEIRAAGVNPSDVKNVLGRFPYTTLPRTPGRDFAGVVVEGPAPLLGQEVWGTGKELGFAQDGTHAQSVIVPARGLSRKPAALTWEQAARCGVPYTTAWDALQRSGVTAGTRLVLIGLGAVGKAAQALAHWRGAQTLLAVRRPAQVDSLVAEGQVAFPLTTPDRFGPEVRARFATGADVIFDTTGFWLEPAVASLAPFGRIAVIAAPADGRVSLPLLELYRRGGSVVGVNTLLYDTVACAAVLTRLAAGFDSHALPPPPQPVVRPLEEAVQVYRDLDAGTQRKIVLRCDGVR